MWRSVAIINFENVGQLCPPPPGSNRVKGDGFSEKFLKRDVKVLLERGEMAKREGNM